MRSKTGPQKWDKCRASKRPHGSKRPKHTGTTPTLGSRLEAGEAAPATGGRSNVAQLAASIKLRLLSHQAEFGLDMTGKSHVRASPGPLRWDVHVQEFQTEQFTGVYKRFFSGGCWLSIYKRASDRILYIVVFLWQCKMFSF